MHMDPPKLAVGDWIKVGGMDCIVSRIYPEESRAAFGLGEIVYNPDHPGLVRELREKLGWTAGRRKRRR